MDPNNYKELYNNMQADVKTAFEDLVDQLAKYSVGTQMEYNMNSEEVGYAFCFFNGYDWWYLCNPCYKDRIMKEKIRSLKAQIRELGGQVSDSESSDSDNDIDNDKIAPKL